MADPNRIVAVGLLTQNDLSRLGDNFRRSFPVEAAGDFDGLLRAIELADQHYQQIQEIRIAPRQKS